MDSNCGSTAVVAIATNLTSFSRIASVKIYKKSKKLEVWLQVNIITSVDDKSSLVLVIIWKMWHTFKHFIHMQYFLLPTYLVIVFVHWVSTVVCCTNPDNVHCFGTIFPNLNFVFASISAARPVHIQSDQYRSCSTVNKVNNVTTRDRCSRHSSWWEQPKTALWLWVREITWYLYTGFITFCIMFMTATGLESSPQSFGVYTVSQSRSVVTSAENPAPDKSPQSIGELRNGHVANLQELYYTRLVRKMAWYKILIQVLIV